MITFFTVATPLEVSNVHSRVRCPTQDGRPMVTERPRKLAKPPGTGIQARRTRFCPAQSFPSLTKSERFVPDFPRAKDTINCRTEIQSPVQNPRVTSMAWQADLHKSLLYRIVLYAACWTAAETDSRKRLSLRMCDSPRTPSSVYAQHHQQRQQPIMVLKRSCSLRCQTNTVLLRVAVLIPSH